MSSPLVAGVGGLPPSTATAPPIGGAEIPAPSALAAPPTEATGAPAGAAAVGSASVADPALRAALLRRGHALLALGDISAARRFFERAALAGSAEAALAAGGTYDPGVLATLRVSGIQTDPAAAAAWYRRAAALGAAEAAAARLAALQAHGTPP